MLMIGIKEKLETVRQRLDKAASRSGRSSKDITLVAVTKGASVEAVLEVREAGVGVFAENRVQEALLKAPQVTSEWHMVGHLQSNKIRVALELFQMIQSVDSLRLAGNINDEALALNKVVPVLLEVNISGEVQKYGFKPEEIYSAVEGAAALPQLKVMGLMGIAPAGADEAPKREAFKKLRNLFSVCKTLKNKNIEMKHLSMGMSDDFEIAVEEGSNMVRLGRVLFR